PRIAGGFPVWAEDQTRAHRQRAVAVGVLVSADHFVGDSMPLEYAGCTECVISLSRHRQSASAVVARELRGVAEPDQFRCRLHAVFNEDASGVAIRVLLDGELRKRRDRLARNAGAFQRFGIGACNQWRRAAPKTPDRPDEYRVVRSGGIKLLPRRPPFLG